MNAEQRQIAIRESHFRCPVTLLEYDPKTYFDIEPTLPSLLCLTVDHLEGRKKVKGRKVDEESDNIWVLSGIAHEMKDNGSRDTQIAWLKKEIAATVAMFPLHVVKKPGARYRANHMRTVLRFLDDGHTLTDYGRKYIEERGPFSGAYDAAKEREYAEEPKRREKKAKARHQIYEKAKKRAAGSPLSKNKKPKPPSPHGKPPGMSMKDWAQRQRPVLNTSLPS